MSDFESVLSFFTQQDKIAKEMNYILSNQDTVLAQITQLESSITQTEVIKTYAQQMFA